MRLITIFIVLILGTSCTETTIQNKSTDVNHNIIENITALNKYKTPIKTFNEYAALNAAKKINLTKGNITASLNKAKAYKYCAIVVGNHTIVKIIDFNDCKQSGAWDTCMPIAEGYIKKGDLNYKKEYTNNIIGIPDNQLRTMFLFN